MFGKKEKEIKKLNSKSLDKLIRNIKIRVIGIKNDKNRF